MPPPRSPPDREQGKVPGEAVTQPVNTYTVQRQLRDD